MSKQVRSVIRRAVSVRQTNIKIVIVPGAATPAVAGHGWHYETRGGDFIRHPAAYMRRGFSNMRYIASTRRIEVGAAYVAEVQA